MKLTVALLLVAAGCGGAPAADSRSTQAIACDWCPGADAAMQCEYTLGGVTMHVCRCAPPGYAGSDLFFRVEPPLTQQDLGFPPDQFCAHVQSEWAKACPTPVAYTPHAACP